MGVGMSILQLVYLMIPAYVANMVPVFARKWKWNTPLDFGMKMSGKPLIGKNKTWRGLVLGVFSAVIITYGLSLLYWPFAFSAVKWSMLAGSGALLGDAVKSFCKRRVNIPPGKSWVPFDQIDYSIGALALGSVLFFPGWLNALWIVLIGLVGHILINHGAYALGIRQEKW